MSTKELFADACIRGMYPELVKDKKMPRSDWYSSYLLTYLERDIRTIHNVGDLRSFQQFLFLLAGKCSQLLNLSTLAVEIGVAVGTVKRWVSILEASRIIYLLSPYFRNFGKRVVKSPKIYFLDCGLLCHLLSIEDKVTLLKSPFAGPLFENFCIQETVKRFFLDGRRPDIWYARTNNGLEVDLLVNKGAVLYPIEIKLNSTPRVSMVASIERYKMLFPKLPLGKGRIICTGDVPVSLNRDSQAGGLPDYIHWLRK